MFYKTASVAQVCEYFNGKKGNLPVIVNVKNRADYRAILEGLTEIKSFLRISSCFGSSPFPDTSKMLREIAEVNDKVVILGLFHVFGFNGGEIAIKNTLGEIANCNRKIITITYGIDKIIEKKIEEYLPLKDKAQIYFIDGKEDDTPQLSLTSFDLNSSNFYESLKDYFIFLEENGTGYGVVKSKLKEKAFENGIWRVAKQNSAYSLLKEMDENLISLEESYGTSKQWEELIKDIKEMPFRDLIAVLGVDLISAIKKFKVYNEVQKWRVFLWLKIDKTKGYLSLVSQKANTVEEMVFAVYNAILDISPKSRLFKEYYIQRKDLIIALDDVRSIKEFVKLSNLKEKDKVFYLTDTTEVERKETIKCFTQYEYTLEEMQKISQITYPLLAEYLSPFVFNNEILDDYFQDYKFQKTRNILTESFKKKVNNNAITRPFYSLPSRSKVLSKIEADNSVVYWIDALGVEFCSLINLRCKHYGVRVKMHMARAELPTLTKFNQDFSPLTVDKIIKDLDELKHSGENDYDYTKSPLPLYIDSELRIIDNILKNAASDLADKKKVILLSDHGASRLVRIANNILTIVADTKEGEKDEKHGGRCCAWNPDIPNNYDTITDSNNNGFCVISNYDRFKGGRYTGVELHGGATLEEVVVPIIEITSKTAEFKYSLNPVLKLRGRKSEPITITLSKEVLIPKIRIQNQSALLSPIERRESTYTFETGITKSGKYECTFYDDNEEIINGIKFEVESALGSINDDFI